MSSVVSAISNPQFMTDNAICIGSKTHPQFPNLSIHIYSYPLEEWGKVNLNQYSIII
jgi:hypothetical protein